jgi:hypothetical protein
VSVWGLDSDGLDGRGSIAGRGKRASRPTLLPIQTPTQEIPEASFPGGVNRQGSEAHHPLVPILEVNCTPSDV